jgi:hypothetical protein
MKYFQQRNELRTIVLLLSLAKCISIGKRQNEVKELISKIDLPYENRSGVSVMANCVCTSPLHGTSCRERPLEDFLFQFIASKHFAVYYS